MKVIFHLDLDSFFVSAERTINKSLKGKSVVISSGAKRSVISSVSYEAKNKGIRVPMPFYKAKKIDPNVVVVNPNFKLYNNLSKKVFKLIIENFTNKIEIASIDECYIDASNIWQKYGSLKKLAQAIQEKIKEELDLPSSIGVGKNKFVAKMSTNINKPFGITITNPNQYKERFWDLPINEFYGIGKSTSKKLNEINIYKIKDLAICDKDKIKKILGIKSNDYINKANGESDDFVNFENKDLKSISHSKTFMLFDLYSKSEIFLELSNLVAVISKRAELSNAVGKVVNLSMKVGKELKTLRKQVTLNVGINSYDDILKNVIFLFESIWNEKNIHFIGIALSKLENIYESTYQSTIFDTYKAKTKTELIIDSANKTMKNKTLRKLSEYEKIKKTN